MFAMIAVKHFRDYLSRKSDDSLKQNCPMIHKTADDIQYILHMGLKSLSFISSQRFGIYSYFIKIIFT